MRYAYLVGLVPSHLHGQTQHKTLGARLSEDILCLKQKSRFFRTRPGRFFLRSLIKDRTLPIDYRTPIVAKRRRRELKMHNVAYIDGERFRETNLFGGFEAFSPAYLEQLINERRIGYADFNDIPRSRYCVLYAYAIVTRGNEILVHRRGHYIESRRTFSRKLSLGFSAPIVHDDLTLFDINDHGLVSEALTAVAIDLDFEFSSEFPRFEESAELINCVIAPDSAGIHSLLGVVRVKAPAGFQASNRRLAINDLHWIDVTQRHHKLTDFDPWSRYLLREFKSTVLRS